MRRVSDLRPALGPMMEILRDEGVYFRPEDPSEIADALRTLIESPDLRSASAERSSVDFISI